MPSRAFDAFVAPARPRAEIWRTLLGLILAVAIYAASFAAAAGAVLLVLGEEAVVELVTGLVAADSPGPVLFLFATFLGMAAGPMAVARLLHHRPAATLFGRGPRVLRDFAVAAALVGAFYALTVGVWALFHEAVPGLPPRTWLALLPLTLVGILVQTGAEEVLFRGYLMQQLAARFRSPLLWMVLPSLLFGLVHYTPELGSGNALVLVGGAALFGLFAADLTVATGSLGAAWGFHFANNVLALALLATDGTITGVALFVTPYGLDDGAGTIALVIDYLLLVGAWGLCRLVLRR